MKPDINDTAFIESLKTYHERELAWGSLHIVMEDGNLADRDCYFCYGYASGAGDDHGVRLASLICQMPYKQRKKLYNLGL